MFKVAAAVGAINESFAPYLNGEVALPHAVIASLYPMYEPTLGPQPGPPEARKVLYAPGVKQ